MPRLDGTGPTGLGPLTGRGEGYCAIAFPPPDTGSAPYGYAGLAGRPVQLMPSLASARGRAYLTTVIPPSAIGLRGRIRRGAGGRWAGRRRGPAHRY
jgi:hypothetical protein